MIKTLEIDTKTCGKWLPKYILGILRKYPQTNFQEWELVQIHHINEPKKVAVNMVCKFWHPHLLILGEESYVRLDNWKSIVYE